MWESFLREFGCLIPILIFCGIFLVIDLLHGYFSKKSYEKWHREHLKMIKSGVYLNTPMSRPRSREVWKKSRRKKR